MRPYVEAGPAFRTVSSVSVTTTTITNFGGVYVSGPVNSTNDRHLNARSNAGIAMGLGTKFRAGLLGVSPEVRYTRWRADRMADPFLYSNQDQVQVLLGITL